MKNTANKTSLLTKVLACGLIVIVVVIIGVGVNSQFLNESPDGRVYEHQDFKTQYTKEEHIDRIWDLTVETFKDDFDNGKIKCLFVDIVYAFYDDDPEYFLVEIEFYEDLIFKSKFYDKTVEMTTKFIHFIGFIKNDVYYSSQSYYAFHGGKSAYSTYASREYKKYYGNSVEAVLIDGKLIQVYNGYCWIRSYPEVHNLYPCYGCSEIGKEIDASKLKEYMLGNGQERFREYPFKNIM